MLSLSPTQIAKYAAPVVITGAIVALNQIYRYATSDGNETMLHTNGNVKIFIPAKMIGPNTVRIETNNERDEAIQEAFEEAQKVIAIYKAMGLNDYLFVEKREPQGRPLGWTIVPYSRTAFLPLSLDRFIKTLPTLFYFIFGGYTPTKSEREQQCDNFRALANTVVTKEPRMVRTSISSNETSSSSRFLRSDAGPSTCNFCKNEIIKKQIVKEHEGNRVLLDYAPVLPTHLLVTTAAHLERFSDLDMMRNLIAQKTANVLSRHYLAKGNESVYLFHKSGALAGQTVPHWHMHLIAAANKTDEFWGKLQLFKNMLFPRPALSDNEKQKRQTAFTSELSHVIPG